MALLKFWTSKTCLFSCVWWQCCSNVSLCCLCFSGKLCATYLTINCTFLRVVKCYFGVLFTQSWIDERVVEAYTLLPQQNSSDTVFIVHEKGNSLDRACKYEECVLYRSLFCCVYVHVLHQSYSLVASGPVEGNQGFNLVELTTNGHRATVGWSSSNLCDFDLQT